MTETQPGSICSVGTFAGDLDIAPDVRPVRRNTRLDVVVDAGFRFQSAHFPGRLGDRCDGPERSRHHPDKTQVLYMNIM